MSIIASTIYLVVSNRLSEDFLFSYSFSIFLLAERPTVPFVLVSYLALGFLENSDKSLGP
jgi:hypothetical protein